MEGVSPTRSNSPGIFSTSSESSHSGPNPQKQVETYLIIHSVVYRCLMQYLVKLWKAFEESTPLEKYSVKAISIIPFLCVAALAPLEGLIRLVSGAARWIFDLLFAHNNPDTLSEDHFAGFKASILVVVKGLTSFTFSYPLLQSTTGYSLEGNPSSLWELFGAQDDTSVAPPLPSSALHTPSEEGFGASHAAVPPNSPHTDRETSPLPHTLPRFLARITPSLPSSASQARPGEIDAVSESINAVSESPSVSGRPPITPERIASREESQPSSPMTPREVSEEAFDAEGSACDDDGTPTAPIAHPPTNTNPTASHTPQYGSLAPATPEGGPPPFERLPSCNPSPLGVD